MEQSLNVIDEYANKLKKQLSLSNVQVINIKSSIMQQKEKIRKLEMVVETVTVKNS